MTIRDIRELKQDARDALAQSPNQRDMVVVYTAVLVGASVLLNAADYFLAEMISGTGGLGNLSTRSVLSTLQTMLPIVQMMLLLGWNAGYSIAVLKLSRREYVDRRTLKEGFSLFWPMLRAMVLEYLIYFSLVMLSSWLSMQIYLLSPWAKDLMTVLEPVLPSILSSTMPVLEDALLIQAMDAMLPMVILFGVLYMLLAIPVSYRLRMSTFCLIDAPRKGAMHAMRTSRRIMRGNCRKLFKLDLSMWWYHGLLALASGIQMLPMFGVLPWSFDFSFYFCYGIYLAILSAVYVLLRNRVETTYAAAYETIREKPKETEQSNAVVLGNIFDM